MQLSDHKPSISELPKDKGMEIIMHTRKERMISKRKKSKSKKVKNPAQTVLAFGASLEEDKLEDLIAKLESLTGDK